MATTWSLYTISDTSLTWPLTSLLLPPTPPFSSATPWRTRCRTAPPTSRGAARCSRWRWRPPSAASPSRPSPPRPYGATAGRERVRQQSGSSASRRLGHKRDRPFKRPNTSRGRGVARLKVSGLWTHNLLLFSWTREKPSKKEPPVRPTTFSFFFLFVFCSQQRGGNPSHTISTGQMVSPSRSPCQCCVFHSLLCVALFHLISFSPHFFCSCCHHVCAVLSVRAGEPPPATKWCLLDTFLHTNIVRARCIHKENAKNRGKDRKQTRLPLPSVLLTPRLFWLLNRCRVEPRGHSS